MFLDLLITAKSNKNTTATDDSCLIDWYIKLEAPSSLYCSPDKRLLTDLCQEVLLYKILVEDNWLIS